MRAAEAPGRRQPGQVEGVLDGQRDTGQRESRGRVELGGTVELRGPVELDGAVQGTIVGKPPERPQLGVAMRRDQCVCDRVERGAYASTSIFIGVQCLALQFVSTSSGQLERPIRQSISARNSM